MPDRKSLNSPSTSLEDDIALMLAYVYRQFYAVQGKKIRGRNPLDVFQHRVKVASYQPSFRRFIEKLAHGLGLQFISIPAELLEQLDERGDEVLDLLREESVFFVARAYNISKKLKKVKDNENPED